MNRSPNSSSAQAVLAATPPAVSGARRPNDNPRLAPWFAGALALAALAAAFALSPDILGPIMLGGCFVWAAIRWPSIFVILTMWTCVAPTVYAFQVGSFGFAPYILFESVAMVGLVVGWVSGRITFAVPPGFKWLVAHVMLTSASALLSSDPTATASMLVRLWFNWLAVFLILAIVPNRARLRALLTALLLQALVVVSVNAASSLANLDLPSFPSLLFLHFQKNDYATYLSFAVALAVVSIAAPRNRIITKIAGVALLMLVSISWPLTYSRSGMMSLVAMIVTLMILYRNKRLLSVLAVIAFVVAVAWSVLPAEVKTVSMRAIDSLFTGTEGGRDSFVDTYEDRVVLNWAALQTIAQKPLLGIGLGEWMAQSPLQVSIWDIKKEGVISVGANIHNRYLLIAAESGVATLLSYLGFLFIVVTSAIRVRLRADPWMRLLLSSLVACTIGFLVSDLFIPGTLWEWNLLAVLAAAVNMAQSEVRAAAPRRVPFGFATRRWG
jgi:O-antigen ligase